MSIRRFQAALVCCAAAASFMLPGSGHAGGTMIVCRDANGNAYFSDRRVCPEGATSEGRQQLPSAQTVENKERFNMKLLNDYERRYGARNSWHWKKQQ